MRVPVCARESGWVGCDCGRVRVVLGESGLGQKCGRVRVWRGSCGRVRV